jgi:beta-lactamase superfamily II metal-dependent hydrolase
MATSSIRIRMYDVGFGDCFLVTIPAPDRPRRILFDCGSIGMDGKTIGSVVDELVQAATDPGQAPRIDLVVATHRHRDHVSGFASKAWSQVTVGEVWMPWTEDPKDSQARDIRETQSRLAATLSRSLALVAHVAKNSYASQLLDVVGNALSNDAAMNTLHHGFAGNPTRRFLPTTKTGTDPIELPALPGVKIYVLGPSRDRNVIRDMDPPPGTSYLQLIDSLGGVNGDAPRPFANNWITARSTVRLSREDLALLESSGDSNEAAVAVALDKAVNGTSLMLVLQIGAAFLLFPGDAQWGTWDAVMRNPEWVDLLKRTRFYKVGHHGSHNATPKDFVEKMAPKDLWAMVSTKPKSNWPGIPKKELLTALSKRTKKIARSDNTVVPKGFSVVQNDYIETSIPIT